MRRAVDAISDEFVAQLPQAHALRVAQLGVGLLAADCCGITPGYAPTACERRVHKPIRRGFAAG